MNGVVEYGGIYLVSFAPSVGHEYQGQRPAVVIQSDNQIKRSSLVTVMPLTSQVGKPHSDDIFVKKDKTNNLFSDSLVKVHSIESFDQVRFIKKIGILDKGFLQQIQKYLKLHFDIN